MIEKIAVAKCHWQQMFMYASERENICGNQQIFVTIIFNMISVIHSMSIIPLYRNLSIYLQYKSTE